MQRAKEGKEMNSLVAAIRILDDTSKELYHEPLAVWEVVKHASDYLNEQLAIEIRGSGTIAES